MEPNQAQTTESGPKKRKLTKKERGFVRDYVLTENGTQSALKNYDTDKPNVANAIAVENLQKPIIQEAIVEAKIRFAERFKDEEIEEVIKEGFKSTTVRFTPDGEKLEVPDYSTRHKYANTAIEIKGYKAPEKHLNISIEVEPSDRIKELARRLKDEQISIPEGQSVQEGSGTLEQGEEDARRISAETEQSP